MIQTDLSDDTFDGYLIAPLQSDSVASLIADIDRPLWRSIPTSTR